MSEMAVERPFVARLQQTMDDNPLPSYEEIKQYFPPSGSFITDDETGYHFLAFTVKSEDVPEGSDE